MQAHVLRPWCTLFGAVPGLAHLPERRPFSAVSSGSFSTRKPLGIGGYSSHVAHQPGPLHSRGVRAIELAAVGRYGGVFTQKSPPSGFRAAAVSGNTYPCRWCRHSQWRKQDLTRAPRLAGLLRLEARYNHGYTKFIKTAISIPDSLFEEADRLAKSRGWSRSELYANAVTAYVKSERFSGVREKLDDVYGNNEEDSAIDPFLADAQARSLPREKW
jgi:hypothetical protein